MKLILVCLLALSALELALPSGSTKTRAIKRNKPLVGIFEAPQVHIEKYPYTVSTFSDDLNRTTGGGVILTNSWVLTTNSQLYAKPIDDITVRGGSDNSKSGGQSSKVAKVISNYTGYWLGNLALLKLKTKFVFNKQLKTIKLATKLPSEKSMATLSGFGENEVCTGNIQAADFKISSYSKCKSYYISDTIICSELDKYMPFYNDLGDPFVQKKKLVGIYNGDDGLGLFTFMAIPKFRHWIIQTIKENSEGDEADGIDDFGAQANDDDDDDDDDTDE